MTILNRESLKSDFIQRWGVEDWKVKYPWWRVPANVRILMYSDGAVQFNGGPFNGLQYVKTLLESRAYYYVDFDIATAHRDGGDNTATIQGAKKLTDLDIIKNYDQIWFFGYNETPNLSPAEVALLDQFMAAPKFGGVLVTGDHANLGRSIAGQITRAGQMRRYPAPPAAFPQWNTTLEEGPDANTTFDFDDQSDDRPQTVRLQRYSVWSPHIFERRTRPHPVMCGPNGPITVFPDHQHEGEALAPTPSAADANWPTKAGHQERPEVISWGKIKDPTAVKHGQEIGLVSAYNGHNVDVGRIIADSTWHHWFDINLTGRYPSPSPYAGFDATTAGQTVLKQLDAYFLNCGVWLAPPDKQAAMRHAAWWSVLWTDRIVELPVDSPVWYLGQQAIDALGQRAPRCTVSQWIFDVPIFKEKIPRWEWPQYVDKFNLIHLPFEHFMAGGILRQLMRAVGASAGERVQFPQKAPSDEQLAEAINMGIEDGLSTLKKQLQHETAELTKLLENNFHIKQEPNRHTAQ